MKGGSDVPPVKFNRSQDHHELYLNLIRWELDDEMQNKEEIKKVLQSSFLFSHR